MDYEKKYKEALERAKKELQACGSTDCDAARQIIRLFPELKESEDELVRKALIEIFSLVKENKKPVVSKEDADLILAWLEKQEYTFEIKEGHWYKCVCDYMLNNSDLMFKNDRLYYCRSDWRLDGEIDERNVKYIGVNGYKSFFRPATNHEIKDWLEKQGESQNKGEISDGYHTFNELYYYRMLYNAAFFNMLPKEWVHKSKKHHDGEDCFGGGWFIVMANLPTGQISNHYELKDWDLFQIPEKEVADKWDGHTPQEAADRLHKYLLEKQGERKFANSAKTCKNEQKAADKVEQKFHEGEWVVYKNDICQIVKREEGCNKLVTVFGIEKELVNERNLSTARLWTIADAKDGDVLVDGNFVGLFKENNYNPSDESGCTYLYCSFDMDNNKFYTESGGYNPTYLYPATKEQRNLLFAKMKEAGYEWDAVSKKLKKIEQKPSWSKETSKTTNVGNSSITVEGMYNPTKDASI